MKLTPGRLSIALSLNVAAPCLAPPAAAQQLGATNEAHWDLGFDDRAPQGVVDEVAVTKTSGFVRYHVPGCAFCVAQLNVLMPYDDGSGLRLLLGGSFIDVAWGPAHAAAESLALFDGVGWSPWPGGPPPGRHRQAMATAKRFARSARPYSTQRTMTSGGPKSLEFRSRSRK